MPESICYKKYPPPKKKIENNLKREFYKVLQKLPIVMHASLRKYFGPKC